MMEEKEKRRKEEETGREDASNEAGLVAAPGGLETSTEMTAWMPEEAESSPLLLFSSSSFLFVKTYAIHHIFLFFLFSFIVIFINKKKIRPTPFIFRIWIYSSNSSILSLIFIIHLSPSLSSFSQQFSPFINSFLTQLMFSSDYSFYFFLGTNHVHPITLL